MVRSSEQIAALRDEVAGIQGWYHAVDLGDGIVTPGPFDLRADLDSFEFPARLDGARVLDVGCSSGFFSAEFVRRGAAEVVGVDLPRWIDGDWPPAYRRRYAEQKRAVDRDYIDQHTLRAPFALVARELGCGRMRKLECRIDELDPERCGTFDLVFCGSMLMHVRDPLLGLQCLRTVCSDRGLFIASFSALRGCEGPLARFAGDPLNCNFWQLSAECFVAMLAVADFAPLRPPWELPLHAAGGRFSDPHIVVHARPLALDLGEST